MEKIFEIFKGVPENLSPVKAMNESNEKILIYSGPFKLKTGDTIIETNGNIVYIWNPNAQIKIHPNIESKSAITETFIVKHFQNNTELDLIIDDFIFGKVRMNNISINYGSADNVKPQIVLSLLTPGILKDISINTNEIKFDIPNITNYFGLNTKRTEGPTNIRGFINRMVLESDEFTILLDKLVEYDDTHKKLKENGGVMIQATGLLKSRKPIQYKKAINILNCFSCFISFLNGRKTNSVFISGVHEENVLWEYHDSIKVHSYSESHSFFVRYRNNEQYINELWNNFYKLWNNLYKKMFQSLMHWYTESNIRSGLIDGALVSSQIALELLFNVILVERKLVILKDDAEKISAAGKLRLLLNQINFNFENLNDWNYLKSYVENNKSKYNDAFDALVFIRNAVVHSNFAKRQELNKISNNIMDDALECSLQFIELLFLYFCDYKGEYLTRIGNVEFVPWIRQ